MTTTKRLGYICTCGRQVRLGGGGIETADELEAWRDKKRREHWAIMVAHSEAVGGCPVRRIGGHIGKRIAYAVFH